MRRWVFFLFGFFWLSSCDKPRTEGFGVCGDGVRNKGEECDQGTDNSWFRPDACRPDCTRARCGDGIKDSAEECDRAQTGGLSCSDLGFDKGILRCSDDCTFDVRLCSRCGNGVAETGESCDLGDLGGATCAGAGFSGGGTLGCGLDCEYDLSGCIDGCGNGIIEGSEACDRTVSEPDCRAWGFESGQVRCDAACRLDFSFCSGGCGNGRLEEGETCDDGNREPLDGCVGCREPSGIFEEMARVELPYLVTDVDAADVDGDSVMDLLIATFSEDGTTGALAWTSGAENHAVIRVLAVGPFLFARAAARPSGVPGIFGVSSDGIGGTRFHWASSWNAQFSATSLSDRPMAVLSADMDGDGADDLLFSAFAAQNVGVFQAETGTFSGINVQGGMPQALSRIDYNRDGQWDLVVVRSASQMLSLLRRISTGEWMYESARYLGGRPGDLAVADVDGDGVDDVLVLDLSASKLYALKGDAGSLTTRVELTLPSPACGIAAGRVDADAVTDLVLALPSEKSVAVFSGSGNWSFSRAFTFGPCETPDRVRLADMDGDGFLDLVLSCRYDRRAFILRSVPR